MNVGSKSMNAGSRSPRGGRRDVSRALGEDHADAVDGTFLWDEGELLYIGKVGASSRPFRLLLLLLAAVLLVAAAVVLWQLFSGARAFDKRPYLGSVVSLLACIFLFRYGVEGLFRGDRSKCRLDPENWALGREGIPRSKWTVLRDGERVVHFEMYMAETSENRNGRKVAVHVPISLGYCLLFAGDVLLPLRLWEKRNVDWETTTAKLRGVAEWLHGKAPSLGVSLHHFAIPDDRSLSSLVPGLINETEHLYPPAGADPFVAGGAFRSGESALSLDRGRIVVTRPALAGVERRELCARRILTWGCLVLFGIAIACPMWSLGPTFFTILGVKSLSPESGRLIAAGITLLACLFIVGLCRSISPFIAFHARYDRSSGILGIRRGLAPLPAVFPAKNARIVLAPRRKSYLRSMGLRRPRSEAMKEKSSFAVWNQELEVVWGYQAQLRFRLWGLLPVRLPFVPFSFIGSKETALASARCLAGWLAEYLPESSVELRGWGQDDNTSVRSSL